MIYKRKLVLIIAGEASGDLHGSHLVTAMKRLDPHLEFCGIGGEYMHKAGVNLLFSATDMAAVGLTEVFEKLSTILRAAKKIKSVIKKDHPGLLILIDYPEFNLHLAKTAKRFNTPVLYYISPQVWAWRQGRTKKIARLVDRMAVILPFEKAYYSGTSLSVEYVGHPLLDAYQVDADANTAVQKPNPYPGRPVVGLLPGSRKDEIRNLLPDMVEAAGILKKTFPNLLCVLPLAPGIDQAFVQPFVDHSPVTIELRKNNIYGILNGCDLALVTSGTATLETAIAGVPMVIVYRMSPISFWLAKRFIDVPFIGLVNLVAEEGVATELIQGAVTPERLAQEARIILEDNAVRERIINKLDRVRQRLGKGGASERTARIALQMM